MLLCPRRARSSSEGDSMLRSGEECVSSEASCRESGAEDGEWYKSARTETCGCPAHPAPVRARSPGSPGTCPPSGAPRLPAPAAPLPFAARGSSDTAQSPRPSGADRSGAELPAAPRALCQSGHRRPGWHGSPCGSAGRLRLRPIGTASDKGRCGPAAGPQLEASAGARSPWPALCHPAPGAAGAGQDRRGQERTGQERTGADRRGQDRRGQDRTGGDPAFAGRARRCPAVLSRRARLCQGTRTSPPRTSEEAGSLREGEAGICCVAWRWGRYLEWRSSWGWWLSQRRWDREARKALKIATKALPSSLSNGITSRSRISLHSGYLWPAWPKSVSLELHINTHPLPFPSPLPFSHPT